MYAYTVFTKTKHSGHDNSIVASVETRAEKANSKPPMRFLTQVNTTMIRT